jgi:hypothetical protein
MSAPDTSPAPQPPSPMRLLPTSPGPATSGYGRVPVTDDADDEQFHDGFPIAMAGMPSTACGTAPVLHSRMGGKYLAPLALPSPGVGGPGHSGVWAKSARVEGLPGLPWAMSELGSVMSGAGDTSRMTGATGDGGGTSSAAFADSPAPQSTVRNYLVSALVIHRLRFHNDDVDG